MFTHGHLCLLQRLPWWLRWQRICLQCRRPGSIPGLGRSPGGGHGNPLWESCLENPMDRGAWWKQTELGSVFAQAANCRLHA